MNAPPIEPPQAAEAARLQLLAKEKELTRACNALAAERRRVRPLAMEKEYAFIRLGGPTNLVGMFDGHRQSNGYRSFFDLGDQVARVLATSRRDNDAAASARG